MNATADFALRLTKSVAKVSEKLDADILVYYGGIKSGREILLEKELSKISARPNVALFMTTGGGSPDTAYRIAKLLQRTYKRFYFFVGRYCKSAGTLISVGADELIMADSAELGPLDIQISKKDDLIGRDSGLTPLQALSILKAETFKAFEEYFISLINKSGGQISTHSAAKFAAQLTTECFSSIYQQIDPMKLAEYERAINITYQYGLRINRGNLIGNEALDALITDYPSHGFVIDRDEAKRLFREVREPTDDERVLGDLLSQYGSGMHEKTGNVVVDFLSGPAKVANRNNRKTRAKSHGKHKSRPSGSDAEQNGKAPKGTDHPKPSEPVRAKLPAKRQASS